MFCTTECWSCEDKNCEHYVSKENLYFENKQLKDRINKVSQLRKVLNNIILDMLPFDIAEQVQDLFDEILKGDSDE